MKVLVPTNGHEIGVGMCLSKVRLSRRGLNVPKYYSSSVSYGSTIGLSSLKEVFEGKHEIGSIYRISKVVSFFCVSKSFDSRMQQCIFFQMEYTR